MAGENKAFIIFFRTNIHFPGSSVLQLSKHQYFMLLACFDPGKKDNSARICWSFIFLYICSLKRLDMRGLIFIFKQVISYKT